MMNLTINTKAFPDADPGMLQEMLGNGWTVDVVSHIFQGLVKQNAVSAA